MLRVDFERASPPAVAGCMAQIRRQDWDKKEIPVVQGEQARMVGWTYSGQHAENIDPSITVITAEKWLAEPSRRPGGRESRPAKREIR